MSAPKPALALATALTLLVSSGPAAWAELVTYPGPPGIQPSDQYAVDVGQRGATQPSFTYLVKSQARTNKHPDASWTTFSFAGRVTVKVTKLQGTPRTCRVLPTNCVIWQLENGAPFQIGWNMAGDNHGLRIRDCDVIRVEHAWNNPNEAVFDSIHGGSGHMHDYVFENIRIENAPWRLFHLTIATNEFAKSASLDRISNLLFRNITVTGPAQKMPNLIKGWDAERKISDITFENVRVNGRPWTSAQEANFQLDATTTSNIQFRAARTVATPTASNQTLREAAGKRLLIGCAVSSRDLQDRKLAELIATQFNCITPEFELMPAHMVNDQRAFDFRRADAVVNFAEQHQMPVLGHMLVWHFETRHWLFERPDGQPLPREEALANLKKYVTAVMGHYQGRIQAWNVVNEALSDQAGEYLKNTPARRAIGEDYIKRAFTFAHAADPQAKLYYNDYNLEQPEKLAKAVRLVRSLKAKGVPLDAVGIQGHWLLNWPPPAMIEKGLQTLAAEGLEVMITELDVDPLPREHHGADMAVTEKGSNPYPGGLPPELQAKLARRYGEIVSAALREPALTMLGFWGTHDGRSWLNNFPVKGRTNHPLLFDRQLRPKPAFDAVRKALEATATSGGN